MGGACGEPLHPRATSSGAFAFSSRADNARFSARLALRSSAAEKQAAADEIGYGGSHDIAMGECFLREASLALELIIKAVIARRIETGIAKGTVTRVRAVHDLPLLWADAELPALSRDDAHSLLIAKRTLMWSGRYAAPLKDVHFEKEEEAFELVRDKPQGSIGIRKLRSLDWDNFDRLYGIAAEAFWKISEGAPEVEQPCNRERRPCRSVPSTAGSTRSTGRSSRP